QSLLPHLLQTDPFQNQNFNPNVISGLCIKAVIYFQSEVVISSFWPCGCRCLFMLSQKWRKNREMTHTHTHTHTHTTLIHTHTHTPLSYTPLSLTHTHTFTQDRKSTRLHSSHTYISYDV